MAQFDLAQDMTAEGGWPGAAIHAAQLGGLRLGTTDDDGARDGALEVCFRSPLVTKRPTLKLRFDLEAAPEGIDRITIESAEGVLAEVAVPGAPSREAVRH